MALHYKTYMAKFLEGGCNDTHVRYISLTVSQDSKYFQDPMVPWHWLDSYTDTCFHSAASKLLF